MKISNIACNLNFNLPKKVSQRQFVGINFCANKTRGDNLPVGGIYVQPVGVTKTQIGTVQKALYELENLKFSSNDLIYMRNLGAKLPFESGREVVDYIKNNNISVEYASFSNQNIHACLDYKSSKTTLLVNSNYKDMAKFSDILAISETLAHEAGHAKDKDISNSIQEEFDCLALNVVIHQAYKAKYPGVFDKEASFLYREGINLYNSKFFDFDPLKIALKEIIAQKYGYLLAGDFKHPSSRMASEIKQIAQNNPNL